MIVDHETENPEGERIVSVNVQDDLPSLRPLSLREFIGQNQLKENLAVFIESARKQQIPLDHVLLSGPPGLGKTTLATIISKEMGVNLKITSGPSIEKAGDLAALLTQLERSDILFIDEIHRLPRTIEEILYSAMEDFKLDLMVGEGPTARSLRIEIPPFTLVGATTRSGLLSSPLRSRFGIPLHLDFYTDEQMAEIVSRSAKILALDLKADASLEIARRSRRTPRIANRLLRRVRDFAIAGDHPAVSLTLAQSSLDKLNVDTCGLDSLDKKLMLAIIDQFKGGPVGIDTLSAFLNEERDTLEELCEPFLLQAGLLSRSSRGRIVTDQGYNHLKKKRETDLPLFQN